MKNGTIHKQEDSVGLHLLFLCLKVPFDFSSNYPVWGSMCDSQFGKSGRIFPVPPAGVLSRCRCVGSDPPGFV